MVLDSVISAVSQKVKTAIKAKLNELGIYVDDELPDYIMILVGNGKTKDQMDDDLSLFLGHNTERFTSWLHEVLQKLNAASLLQKENKAGKEKKKEEEKEKEKEKVPEVEETKVVVEEKKKHKKKKDKSEKKKEKKEKKKKKDKEKHSKSHKNKGKETSKSKSRSPISLKTEEPSNEAEADSVLESSSSSTSKKYIDPASLSSVSNAKSIEESESASHLVKDDEIPSDVVNLRPNAEDLALGLEDEPPSKKIKVTKSVIKEVKEKEQKVSSSPEQKLLSTITNIEIKVDNPRAKEPKLSATSDDEVSSTGIHERLGPKRVINLREESSFPPRSAGEGMGRVISSAIASAVKSVSAEGKPSKRLEARVRPLVSSRIREPEEEEEVDDVALPPTRLVSTVSAVLKRSHSNDDSDDNVEPPTKRVVGIASKVEVMPRPRRTGAQANTALILRAVADAHKSVNKPSKKMLEDKDDEKALKKEIFTRSYQERQSHRLSSSSEGKTLKKFAITVPNSLLKDNVNMKIAEKPTIDSYIDEVEMEGPGDLDSEMELTTTRLKSKVVPQVKTLSTSKVVPLQVDETSGSTRFIVTLDGFGNEVTSSDLRSKLRARPVSVPSVDDEQEIIEEVEEWEEEVEEMELDTPQSLTGHDGVSSTLSSMVPKWKTKIDASDLVTKKEERCRFWPACKEGAACIYIHPSKICNTFPNCRFGEKCLYIHPNCKYDGVCTKPNCPFTHTISRSQGIPNPVALKAKLNPKAKVKCKYYPKCTDMNCPFNHPKQICRYGKKCLTINCLFVHPEITTGSLLKWTAPKPAAKPTADTISSSMLKNSLLKPSPAEAPSIASDV